MVIRILLCIFSLQVLTACSSVPEPIRSAPPLSPSLTEVRDQPERWRGNPVRWGGTIVQINNLPDESHVEIVARDLYRDGEPRPGDQSQGRFLAIIPAFVDPAIYAAGRRLTIHGTLQGHLIRPLGELDYHYPQIAVRAYYLWPELREQPYIDPFYPSPWYPYGYPYRDPYWTPFWRPYPW